MRKLWIKNRAHHDKAKEANHNCLLAVDLSSSSVQQMHMKPPSKLATMCATACNAAAASPSLKTSLSWWPLSASPHPESLCVQPQPKLYIYLLVCVCMIHNERIKVKNSSNIDYILLPCFEQLILLWYSERQQQHQWQLSSHRR